MLSITLHDSISIKLSERLKVTSAVRDQTLHRGCPPFVGEMVHTVTQALLVPDTSRILHPSCRMLWTLVGLIKVHPGCMHIESQSCMATKKKNVYFAIFGFRKNCFQLVFKASGNWTTAPKLDRLLIPIISSWHVQMPLWLLVNNGIKRH